MIQTTSQQLLSELPGLYWTNALYAVLFLAIIVLLFVLYKKMARIGEIIRKIGGAHENNTAALLGKIAAIEGENNQQLMAFNRILSSKPAATSSEVAEKMVLLPKTIEHANLVFNRIELPSIAIKEHEPLKATAASVIPTAIADAYSMSGAKGLYQATAPIEQLMRYKDGTLSSILLEHPGKIQSHSGFVQTSTRSVWTPALVFQLASIVTAQYYLNGINKQLNKIVSKLEDLIQLHHNEKVSKLQADYERLAELSRKDHYELEDLVEIRFCVNSAYAIHREYTNLIQKATIKEFRESIDDVLSSSSSQLEKLNEMYQETKFNVDLLLFSRRVLFSSKLIELKANAYMSRQSPDRVKNVPYIVEDLQEIMKEYAASSRNLSVIVDLMKEYKQAALDIKKEAVLDSNVENAKGLFKKYSADTSASLQEIGDLTKDVESTYKKIKDEFVKEKDIFILVDKDGIQHPLIP